MLNINEYKEITKENLSPMEINERVMILIGMYKDEYETEGKRDIRDTILALCDSIIRMNVSRLAVYCESFDRDDLYNEGIMIAMKAIENFDTDNGTGFVTYLTHALKNTLQRQINYHDRMIVLPEYQIGKKIALKKEAEENGTVYEDGGTRVASLDSIDEDLWKSAYENNVKDSLTEILNDAMVVLSEEELVIIKSIFNFDTDEKEKQVKIAERLNIPLFKVSSLYKKALAKLRLQLSEMGYMEYCDLLS